MNNKEEIIKQADEYVEMFRGNHSIVPIYYGQQTIQNIDVKPTALNIAIKHIEGLIDQAIEINDRTSDCNSYIENKIKDLTAIKEQLKSRLT